jgi:hypothetical protein
LFIESLFLSLLRYNLSKLAVLLASQRSLSLASSLVASLIHPSTASLALQGLVRAFLACKMCWVTSDRSALVLGKVDRAKDARKRTKDVRDTKTKE